MRNLWLIDANPLIRYLLNDNVDNKNIILYAIELFRKYSFDFVDCILIAYNHLENEQVFSFDKKLNSKLNFENFS